MKRSLSILVFAGILLLSGFADLAADTALSPWNHGSNPAFFAFGAREYFELGLSVDVTASNSALGLSDVFQRVVVIDLDEIYASTPNDGLRIGVNGAAEAHLALKFDKFALGFFADSSDLSRIVIPKTFIGLLTQGNQPETAYEGYSEILQRSFVAAGTVASYEIGGFVFAGKFGVFTPLLYSDENAEAGFTLETGMDGTVRGEVFASGDIYTALGEEGLKGLGFNASLGIVRPDPNGDPLFGAALNNIPLVAARPGYVIEVDQLRYEFEATDLLDQLSGEQDPFSTASEIGDIETRALDPSEQPRIHMPLSASGFYRFAVSVIDIVPDLEVVFDESLRLNAGVSVEGNTFPADLISIGFGRRDYLWYARAGLHVPLRVSELAVEVASVGATPIGIFDLTGLGASVSLAFGY